MIRALGKYHGASRTLDGDLAITFTIPEDELLIEQLEKMRGKELTIEAKRYSEPRSLNANKYLWKLCDLMAKKLGSTQDEMHDLMLYRYGQRADISVQRDHFKAIESAFDIVIILEDYGWTIEARCWIGSRFYNREEMAILIEGTVNDAREAGISLLTPEETQRLVDEWENSRSRQSRINI